MQEGGVLSFKPGTTADAFRSGAMSFVKSSNGERESQLLEARAREIFGKDNFLGVEEVEKALNIEINRKNIPKIQFTEAELVRAQELGQRLVLRVSQTKDGQPLTMQFLNEHLQPEFTTHNAGDILWKGNKEWYKDDPFFADDVPETRWALVSNEVIPDSAGKNYLQQTEVIANYLRGEVYGATSGMSLPKKYTDAIEEFDAQKAEIQKLIVLPDDLSHQQEAGKLLTELTLNILTRATPVDTLYDQLIYFKKNNTRLSFKKNNTRLLGDKYTWTSVRSTDGRIVLIGLFDSHGMSVLRDWPYFRRNYIGVALSR